MRLLLTSLFMLLFSGYVSADEVRRSTANNGQLLMEGIPEIPESLPQTLSRYQDIRTTRFVGWTKDSKSIFIKTQNGEVTQLHRVDKPGGTRHQLTFGKEPIGEVARQPGSNLLAITRDKGGDEFDQVYLFNTENGQAQLLSDGKALNNRMAWSRQGEQLAYRSTRRNGRSNDIWLQDIGSNEPATMLLETDDGTLWKPIDFSRDGKKLLVQQFLSVVDSRVYMKDLTSGELRLLAGDPDNPSSNITTGFSQIDDYALFVEQLGFNPVCTEPRSQSGRLCFQRGGYQPAPPVRSRAHDL